MHSSPKNEVEARAVPQSAEEHRDDEVHVLAALAFAVASERDVDVVANPCGERDVPTTPEVGDTRTAVRGVEVAQQQCDADGHVAVAAEIAIDLHGVAIYTEQILESGIEVGVVEDAVDKVERDIVADDGLLEQSDDDEVYTLGEHHACDAQRLADLWGEITRTDDRAGDELREERHVESILEQIGQRFQTAAIHVDGVAHALESEEADTYRQEDVPRLEVVAEHLGNHACEEIGVFKIAEQSEVNQKTERDEPFAERAVVAVAVDGTCDVEVGRGDHGEQEEIHAAALVIEVIGEESHEEQAGIEPLLQEHVDKRESQEQQQKSSAAENHGFLRIVAEGVDEVCEDITVCVHRSIVFLESIVVFISSHERLEEGDGYHLTTPI